MTAKDKRIKIIDKEEADFNFSDRVKEVYLLENGKLELNLDCVSCGDNFTSTADHNSYENICWAETAELCPSCFPGGPTDE